MLLSLVLSVVLLFSSSYSNAQQVTLPSTTGDLLDPSAQNWSGSYGTGYWGGSRTPNTTNPSIPNRLPTDTGFIWGGADNIISTTIAINTALSTMQESKLMDLLINGELKMVMQISTHNNQA